MLDPTQVMSLLDSSSTSAADALRTHPQNAPPPLIPGPRVEEVHHSGQTALWVFFAVMAVSSVIGALMSWNVPMKKRVFHTITTLVFITSSISYFAMALGHAVTWKRDTYHEDGDPGFSARVTFRQIFWARYVDWAITTPLLLLNLSLLAGLAGGHIVMLLAASLIMILSGLFSTMSNTEAQHWGWYAIAIVAYLLVIWHLAVNGRASVVKNRQPSFQKLTSGLSVYFLLLWAIYIVIWAIGRGTALIPVDGEVIAYGVLDVLAKPLFGLWLLRSRDIFANSDLDTEGFWASGASTEGQLRLGDDGA